MRKFLFYILIPIILIGLFNFNSEANAQNTGPSRATGCYYKEDGAYHKKGDPLAYVPRPGVTPQQQCGLNSNADWITVGSTTPTPPISAYQACRNQGSTYESCKILSGAPATPAPTSYPTPDPKYYLLAPLPCVEDSFEGCEEGKLISFDPSNNKDDTNTALGKYLNLMIKIFIGICAVLAMGMIILGGLEYMTSELVSSKESGKHKITGALLGLVLALGSWAILNTINPALLNSDVNISSAIVELSDNVPQVPVNGRYASGSLSYAVGEEWAPRAGQLANLADSRATVYNSQCTNVGQPNCTSIRGLNPSTLNSIRQGCPTCVLLITGGTEFWAHGGQTGSTSHQINSSTVDLDPNPTLNAYLSGGQPLVPNKRYVVGSVSYRWEVNHWHAGP